MILKIFGTIVIALYYIFYIITNKKIKNLNKKEKQISIVYLILIYIIYLLLIWIVL